MFSPRTALTGLIAAAALAVAVPAAAQASAVPTGPDTASGATLTAAKPWGTYYAPGKLAKARGFISATGEDHATIPTADSVKITGKLYDLTRTSKTCGWAVFRITYRDSAGNLPFKHRWARDCSYATPKHFTIKHKDVYQVELKVCAQHKSTLKPTLNCLYAGTWKVLYLSK